MYIYICIILIHLYIHNIMHTTNSRRVLEYEREDIYSMHSIHSVTTTS